MDRVTRAVGERWLAVFAFESVLTCAAIAALPRGWYAHFRVPRDYLLSLHPVLLLGAMSMLGLAFILSVSMHPRSPPLSQRALAAALIIAASALCVCAVGPLLPEEAGWAAVSGLGIRMAVVGAVFAANYFGRRRWLLQFPVVQRPLFYGLKMGILPSGKEALKVSLQAFSLSFVLVVLLPHQFKVGGSIKSQIFTQIRLFIVTTAVSFCLHISHYYVQLVHTVRCTCAPYLGSDTTRSNPTEIILEALERSSPRSLIQYLAYQDLCFVSECKPWRRGFFFEESGETYRRIITACLKPLEEFTSKVAEALEVFPIDEPELMFQQSKFITAFDDSQICTWCARVLAGLTACSRKEDQYGVAEFTGCNAAAMSALLSALVATEACLGKKTNPQQPVHLLGPENIMWANYFGGRKGIGTSVASRERGDLHKKAYAMADVFRTSIYQIVSVFEDDLRANAKPSCVEKNWISQGRKPAYGSHAVLIDKLCLFIQYRAV